MFPLRKSHLLQLENKIVMNDFIQRQTDPVTQHLPMAHQLWREVSLCQFMSIYDLFHIRQDSQAEWLWAVLLHWLKCILHSFTVNNTSILISHSFCEVGSVCFSYAEWLLLLIQLDPAEGCYSWPSSKTESLCWIWELQFQLLSYEGSTWEQKMMIRFYLKHIGAWFLLFCQSSSKCVLR